MQGGRKPTFVYIIPQKNEQLVAMLIITGQNSVVPLLVFVGIIHSGATTINNVNRSTTLF